MSFAKQARCLLAVLLIGTILLTGCTTRREEPSTKTELPAPPKTSTSQEEPGSSQTNTGSSEEDPVVTSSASETPEPADPDPADWRLALVSAAHPLSEEMVMETAEVAGYKVDARIAEDLTRFLAAAKEDGYTLLIISGYRTFAKSSQLYQNEIQQFLNMGYTREAAETEAAKWVAPPGTSEHNTGLAVDIIDGTYYTRHSDLDWSYENDPQAVWMKEHCAEYGFILRYPKGKEAVTGIVFEPWHFRYVGEEHAKAIMEAESTLEEYLGMQP